MRTPFETWMSTIHPADLAKVREMGMQYRDGLIDKYEVTYRVELGDDQERWHVTKGKAVRRDEQGRVTRMVGTVMDITEQKRVEAALRETEERSRLLLASAERASSGWTARTKLLL